MKVLMLVHSDFIHDNRVNREAIALIEAGYEVSCACVGFNLPDSYEGTKLISFEPKVLQGKKKFIDVIRYFGKVIKTEKYDIIHAHDLDGLTAAGFYADKKIPVIYDSHELYLDSISLYNRRFTRFLWSIMERRYIKRAKIVITVCGSIADVLQKKYTLAEKPTVVRNFTDPFNLNPSETPLSKEVQQLAQSTNGLLLYHGVVREGRGLRFLIELLEAKKDWGAVICGDGPMLDELKHLVNSKNLSERTLLPGLVNRNQLVSILPYLNAGLCYIEPLAPSYYYSLPNKLSEYIQSELPILGSDLPEIKAIITEYNIGKTAKNFEDGVEFLEKLESSDYTKQIRTNLQKAASELNWSAEKRKLIEAYSKL